MQAYILLSISFLINTFLIWYIIRLLRKFMFISENLADIFLIAKSFHVFVKNMYSMQSYNGEPMIEELMHRIQTMNEELENFREIFEYSIDEELDEELEEALNAEKEEQESLLYAGTRRRNS